MKPKLILILLLIACLSLQAKPIKVLLITGHTGKWHSWQTTSTYLKAILDHQNIFETDEIRMQDSPLLDETFAPNFSKYQVVVLNIDDVKWSDLTKKAFENYVKNGGGVVIIHEANNAFPEWKEYNLMTGLGGWGNRNEKSGPYVYWENGVYVTDTIKGSGGKHGNRVPFVITIRDSTHPITKGIPTKWLHQNDELYGNLRGPAQNLHILATAFSTKETKGTGKEEPVLMTITYGKGRIFHSVLGHVKPEFADGLQDVGFQVVFSRGTQWAATGKVTQKIPTGFPTQTMVLLHDLGKLKH
ncbi:MAG: ThuA domain-containing protein [Flavobacterium sp.]|nr:ThuA domain-containing protein [Flavobacterium sp.]